MELKEAVKQAKDYVADLFADEGISNLGLEEVEYDDQYGQWLITIGFSRPWNEPKGIVSVLSPTPTMVRSLKTVRIKNSTRQIVSLKNSRTDLAS